MDPRKLRRGLLFAVAAIALAFVLPLAAGEPSLRMRFVVWPEVAAAGLLFVLAAWFADGRAAVPGLLGVVLAAASSLVLLRDPGIAGSAAGGFWAIVIAVWLASAMSVVSLAALRPIRAERRRALNLLVPLLFGAIVFYLWEVAVRGFGVPPVLMPAPSAAAARFAMSLPTLGADFFQTFVKGVLAGYVIGCGAGLLVAILAHRFAFLGRGLLPLGNFFSALPLVGIAPIMVMWFGFDWQSKAAVAAVMTFFPMLISTVAGLEAAGAMERDLLRSYTATGQQTLEKLRLPAALPFVFNALKLNTTLALIGAIVAEFFGTPIVGMGFRISTEAARLDLDVVWAEVLVAAITGSVLFFGIARLERTVTFWRPAFQFSTEKDMH
jgi:NitT/TauT family transport system permease protein